MSPVPSGDAAHMTTGEVTKPTNQDGLILEAWAQGYMVGSLIILSCITLANMRRRVLLHKLILLELVLGYWQGFFIFFHPPIYAWWLSVAAIPLNASWSLHNVIAWMKIKPFLSRKISIIFIATVILVQPYWVVEIYANFTYFHNINKVFLRTRPWEALCRDPWWIVTTIFLFYNIKTKYDLSMPQIIRISPRFAVMLGAMLLSICFIVLDVLSVTSSLKSALPIGINPFWKLSFVFKCLTDAVILDDFKTALDRLRAFKISRLGTFGVDTESHSKRNEENAPSPSSWVDPHPQAAQDMPSPDGDYVQHPRWEEIKGGGTDHVEQEAHRDRVRNMSRDRDSEENCIEEIDHVQQRDASDTHILAREPSWQRDHENDANSEDINVDEEYAEALREMTHEAAPRAKTLSSSTR